MCSFGCAFEYYAIKAQMEFDPCEGETEFHHFPHRSQGGDSTSGMGLCRKHHRQYHDAREELGTFAALYSDTLNRRYLGAYLMEIERQNGTMPAPSKKPKISTRTNRGPLKNRFIPLNERD